MENEVKLAAGAMVSLAVATAALVVLPYMEVRDITPPEGLKPYTSAQQRGRDAREAVILLIHEREFPLDAQRRAGRCGEFDGHTGTFRSVLASLVPGWDRALRTESMNVTFDMYNGTGGARSTRCPETWQSELDQ